MVEHKCKGCGKPIKPIDDYILGANGDYHVTCWNQLGNKSGRKKARKVR